MEHKELRDIEANFIVMENDVQKLKGKATYSMKEQNLAISRLKSIITNMVSQSSNPDTNNTNPNTAPSSSSRSFTNVLGSGKKKNRSHEENLRYTVQKIEDLILSHKRKMR